MFNLISVSKDPRSVAKERPATIKKMMRLVLPFNIIFTISVMELDYYHQKQAVQVALEKLKTANSNRKLKNITFHKSPTLLDFVN